MQQTTIALLVLLGACATVPEPVQHVHTHVNNTRSYANYAARDWRYMQEGESGNCARFAQTYVEELKRVGVSSSTAVCVLKNGIGHAFTITDDGWVLDVRSKWVTRWEGVGCK